MQRTQAPHTTLAHTHTHSTKPASQLGGLDRHAISHSHLGSARAAINIVGTPYSEVQPSACTAARVASGAKVSAGSTMAAPEAMQAMLPITMPKQWYRGTGIQTLRAGQMGEGCSRWTGSYWGQLRGRAGAKQGGAWRGRTCAFAHHSHPRTGQLRSKRRCG